MSATTTDRPRRSPLAASAVAIPTESRARTLPRGGARRLWLAVAAGFVLLGIAWAILFTAAHRAQVQSVPLVESNGGTKP